jgi:hypothetical protein
MANYAITDYVTDRQNTVLKATAAIETYLETVDDAKTIYACQVIAVGGEYVGYVIHKA